MAFLMSENWKCTDLKVRTVVVLELLRKPTININLSTYLINIVDLLFQCEVQVVGFVTRCCVTLILIVLLTIILTVKGWFTTKALTWIPVGTLKVKLHRVV